MFVCDAMRTQCVATKKIIEMAGLYVHVPFCRSKCAYCDFYSMPRIELAAGYAKALEQEYARRKDECGSVFSTLYVGGGTPSSLPADVLEGICSWLPMQGLKECTIEANPEDVDFDAASRWRELGFDRASMGVQSFSDRELEIIGRRHSSSRALEAIETLLKAGFDNFSLDLIYGLPEQSLDSWRKSLSTLLAVRPAHFSCYMLSFEPRTRLSAMLRAGQLSEASEDLIADMYAALCDMARDAGYVHYEISNFALPGFEAKHNSSYWDGTPYLGLGPSAHSFDGSIRRANPSNLKEYIRVVSEGGLVCEVDCEDDSARFNDMLMIRLRTRAGLPLSDVPPSRMNELMAEAARFLNDGSLVKGNGIMAIPEDKWLVSDYIISSLMQD